MDINAVRGVAIFVRQVRSGLEKTRILATDLNSDVNGAHKMQTKSVMTTARKNIGKHEKNVSGHLLKITKKMSKNIENCIIKKTKKDL